RLAVLVLPHFLGVIAGVEHHGLRAPVLLFAANKAAAFDHQDAFAGWSKRIGQSAAPSAGADDDDVIVDGLRHGVSPQEWFGQAPGNSKARKNDNEKCS